MQEEKRESNQNKVDGETGQNESEPPQGKSGGKEAKVVKKYATTLQVLIQANR